MLFTNRESPVRSRTASVDSGIERVVEDICSRFGVTGRGSSALSRKIEPESKANKSSFFGLRTRHNTINSTSSSFQSLPSTAGTSQSSVRSSIDDRTYSSDYSLSLQDYKINAKHGTPREFRATRESSKVSLTSNLGRVEEIADERIDHGASHNANELNLQATGENELKYLISSPFGFQHVAHVPAQKNLSCDSSAVDLFAEQTSYHVLPNTNDARDKGFRWNTSVSATPDGEALGSSYNQQTESETYDLANNDGFCKEPPVVVYERFDNTSKPQPKAITVRQPIKFSNGMTPPPRSSSRNAVARMNLMNSTPDDETSEVADQIHASGSTEQENYIFKGCNGKNHHRHITPETITTSVPRIMDLPHAVTTPDESAVPAISPSYSLDLEDVPEEEEGYFFLGSSGSMIQGPLFESSVSPQKSIKSLQSWGSRPTASDCFPYPCSPVNHRGSQNLEIGEHTLMTSSELNRMRRLSYHFKELDCSWEDDIDFCYEHAAEADCDFDWQSPFEHDIHSSAALHGEIPFGSTLCTSQLNGATLVSDIKSVARK